MILARRSATRSCTSPMIEKARWPAGWRRTAPGHDRSRRTGLRLGERLVIMVRRAVLHLARGLLLLTPCPTRAPAAWSRADRTPRALVALGVLLRLAEVPVLVVGDGSPSARPGRFPALVNRLLRAFQWSGVGAHGLRMIDFLGSVVSGRVLVVLADVLIGMLSRVHGHQ